jgi:hypothetical protein
MTDTMTDELVTAALREALRDVQACFWVGRKELQGTQEFVTRTWNKVKALNAALASTPTVADDELHPAEDGEDHNPDGFVHATPEQARIIADAVSRKLLDAGGDGKLVDEAIEIVNLVTDLSDADALDRVIVEVVKRLERIATRLEQPSGMREALKVARDTLQHLDVESGYCCCGSRVEDHNIGSGHSPVDSDQYAVQQTVEAIDAALGVQRNWSPHSDYAGEAMWPGEFRDPTEPEDLSRGGRCE